MPGRKVISKNRKAFHDYQINETFEAGIVLLGTEVKSIRAGKVNLKEGWVDIDQNSEVILKQVHISHYSHGNINNHNETRARKLLLKKSEIKKLSSAVQAKGYALIPTQIYLRGQFVKIEIGLAKGKKLHDKRESHKEKDAQRNIERALKTVR